MGYTRFIRREEDQVARHEFAAADPLAYFILFICQARQIDAIMGKDILRKA